jgi:integrase/recombinase XerD
MKNQVNNFLNYLAVEKGFSGNTIVAYRNDLYNLATFLDKRFDYSEWTNVGADAMSEFVLDLKSREYSSTTIARKIASVKSFFSFLINEGLMISDPSQTIQAPRIGRSIPKALSEDEVGKLLQAPLALKDPERGRDKAMLELLYATGIRVTELVSLDLHDLDLAQGIIRCRGKGGKERIIPYHDTAWEALDSYLGSTRPALLQRSGSYQNIVDEPALFLNQRGDRLTRQGFWLILKAHASRARIRMPVTPHTLRHSFATHMLRGGASLRQVQEFLGHASVATTQVYTHLTNEHVQEEYDRSHPRAR